MDENKNAETLEKGKRHWYVIHTYSGYENKVSANLERKVHSLGMSDRIFHIMIPMENEVVADENGPDNKQPVPLSDEEVKRIMTGSINGQGLQEEEGSDSQPKAKPQINLQLQQRVRLKTGPFASFEGVVSAIDRERGKLKVLVDMFGRETPVDIDYTQVEEIE